MDENLKTARYEAAHAIAALHYDLPFEFASIERGCRTRFPRDVQGCGVRSMVASGRQLSL